MAVKNDVPGSVYQAFALCGPGETPVADDCVAVTLLDANHDPLPPGSLDVPAFVVFDGVTGHFSTFAVVVVAPPLPGDYNSNGIVDAADYTVWRDALGQSGLTPFSGADGDGDGEITQADYGVWKSHYGETLPPPGAGSVAIADVAMEQPLTVGSGAATLAFVEPAFQIGDAIEQMPAETTSTPIESEVEKTRAADLAILDNRFARHDSVSRPFVRINSSGVAELVHDNLLLLLANDRVGRPSRQDFSTAGDRNHDDHREDDLDIQSLTDEPLELALAEWR